MVTMILMSGIRLASEEIRRQIANAIDLIIYTELYMDGRRRITNVTDVEFVPESDNIYLRDIFRWETEMFRDGKVLGDWVMDSRPPSFLKKLKKRNVILPQGFFKEQ